ncbi:MAG: hypothetical protein H0W72_15990 [Planctomycetes bacterium]|nr:hypothetical protein [Planctomycetota bacterium]
MAFGVLTALRALVVVIALVAPATIAFAPGASAEMAATVDLLAERDFEASLHRVISGARISIDAAIYLVVLSPDARPAQPVRRLLDALIAAQRRGVAVRVLVDAGAPPSDTGESARPSLTAARYLRDGGVDTRWDEDQRISHAKALSVDGAVCVIGSGNWTVGGLRDNRELAVEVRSPGLATQFAEFFATAWVAGHRVD